MAEKDESNDFVFYWMVPVVIAVMIGIPLSVSPSSPVSWMSILLIECISILFLLGLYNSQRFECCFRIIAGIVLLGTILLCPLLFIGESVNLFYALAGSVFVLLPVGIQAYHYMQTGKLLVKRSMSPSRIPEYRLYEEENSLVLHAPNRATTEVNWDELEQIEIHTNDLGPGEFDVWWVLKGSRSTLRFPEEAALGTSIIQTVMIFPDFDHENCTKALSSTDNAVFVVWKKEE